MKMIKKIIIGSALIGLSSGAAMAADVTGNFQATSTLNSSCLISAQALSFGAIDQANGNQVSTTITSRCSKNVSYSILPNQGLQGTVNFRALAGTTVGNTDTLTYGIFKDAGLSSPFNNANPPIALVGTGIDQTTNLYGYLFNNQYKTPDAYSDTVTLTLSY